MFQHLRVQAGLGGAEERNKGRIRMNQLSLDDVSVREFNRLIADLLQGRMQRNGFRRWEIAILLDLETCKLRRSTRRETLRRYQQVMSRRLDNGEALLLPSEYLAARRRRRRNTMMPEAAEALASAVMTTTLPAIHIG